ncbi:MAG TPA: phosphoribosylformimino-5-aminoimidazole carboxamide ribotide isomerase [Methanosarcinaceae archaeon]|nr:phosphoribosylformimino-5-aminoimidazole carboxamide ribotide isomerase [Methanosarcinaceae archaeon]
MFRIIFVLDIYNRTVVHAQGGNRQNYQPIHKSSVFCNSSGPLAVIDAAKPKEVYVADLNILQGIGAHDINFEYISAVSKKVRTMLDPGISSPSDVNEALSLASSVVLGTETASLDTISSVASEFPGRVNVSIDIKNGRILAHDPGLPDDPIEVIGLLNDMAIQDIIILDMDRVGTSNGVDTQFLSTIADSSKHNVLLGGGVKDMDDIEMLKNIGLKGALVATALHNGTIPLTMIQ